MSFPSVMRRDGAAMARPIGYAEGPLLRNGELVPAVVDVVTQNP
jgi:hypothetical protein